MDVLIRMVQNRSKTKDHNLLLERELHTQYFMKHTTKKAKAVTFLTNKAEKIKIGPHSTLEYFILSAILNGEGVLSNSISTRLGEDDLECLSIGL